MSSVLYSFESRFIQFCELFKHCDKSNSMHVARLLVEYKALQQLGRTLPNSNFEHFTFEHKILKDYFDFGKDNYQSFCLPCIALITSDKQSSTKRVMDYFKQPQTLTSLTQQRPLDANVKQKLQDLLGGQEGLDVADDFVATARMDRFSQIMGYVLSGLAQEDLNTYHMKKQISSKIFKYRNQSVADFLSSQIVEQDCEFVVQTSESMFGVIPIAGAISTYKTPPRMFFETTPNSSSPNSLFINHTQKRITAVVTNMLENPTQTLVATHQSLKQLCAQNEIEHTDNPLYGYATEICFFHTGASFEQDTSSHTVTSYLKDLTSAPLGLRQTLMRGAFLSLVGSGVVGKTLRDTLRDTNMHVLGTDSEKLYHAMRSAAEVDQHDVKSREMGCVVLNEMTAVLEMCANPTFISTLSDFQTNLIKQVFSSVEATTTHYFSIFPLKNKQKITLSEKRKINHIAHLLDTLKPTFGLDFQTHSISFTQLFGPNGLENTATAQSQKALTLPLGYNYSPEIYKDIQTWFALQKENQRKKNMLSGFLLDNLARANVPECFNEFLNHARADSVSNPLPSSDKSREFFADVQRMCGGKKTLNALSSQEANLSNPRAAFRRWVNQVCVHLFEHPTAAGESVVVLSELFNTSLWHDRSLIPFSPKMKSVVGGISQVMLEHSRQPSGTHLSSLLETVYQTPRRKMH